MLIQNPRTLLFDLRFVLAARRGGMLMVMDVAVRPITDP